MRLRETSLIVALLSFAPLPALACAVDGVAAITTTTISISWDLTACKKLSANDTFKVCWKKQSNSGDVCIPPTVAGYGETGTSIITGLSPETPYKIKTLWHKKSGWQHVTTRVVTTQASPGSSSYLLRYEKHPEQKYTVDFYWRGPALASIWIMELHVDHNVLGQFQYDRKLSQVVTSSPLNASTGEYSAQLPGFSNNRRYQAFLVLYTAADPLPKIVSNVVQWK